MRWLSVTQSDVCNGFMFITTFGYLKWRPFSVDDF